MEFLETLAETLKGENKDREWDNQTEIIKKKIFDIPFLTSSLWEAFRAEPNTYSDFVKCLNKHFYQIRVTEQDNDYYGICKAIIDFYKSKELYEVFEEY